MAQCIVHSQVGDEWSSFRVVQSLDVVQFRICRLCLPPLSLNCTVSGFVGFDLHISFNERYVVLREFSKMCQCLRICKQSSREPQGPGVQFGGEPVESTTSAESTSRKPF